MLQADFFDRHPVEVARVLLGKVLRRRQEGRWLCAAVVEAEAYAIDERGSHASLGRTPSREALWGSPGTIYMYFSRGGDSLNVSCRGGGAAVLFKAGLAIGDEDAVAAMQAMVPLPGGRVRPRDRICSGQTLLARSLGLRVGEWTGRPFDETFHVADVGYRPEVVVQTTRLGIPPGRDEHLPWRFLDAARAAHATSNPLTRRGWTEGAEYRLLAGDALAAPLAPITPR